MMQIKLFFKSESSSKAWFASWESVIFKASAYKVVQYESQRVYLNKKTLRRFGKRLTN